MDSRSLRGLSGSGTLLRFICAQPEMGQYQNGGRSRKLMSTDPKEWKRTHVLDISAKSWNSFNVLRRLWIQKIHNHSQDARFRSLSDFIMKMFVVENKIFLEKTCRYYITVNLIWFWRLFTSVGKVGRVDPDCPNRVRFEGHKNYREVLRIITRHSTSMISNDTQSPSEYSISQYYWSSLLYVLLWRRLKFSLIT